MWTFLNELNNRVWSTLLNEANELAAYVIAHPQGTVRFILGSVCLLLLVTVLNLAYNRDIDVGKSGDVDTETATFMIVSGGIFLFVSVISVVWYLYTADINVLEFFKSGIPKH